MQILPLAAQGLWIRMMCWASENEMHRGFLELPTGAPMTELDIAHRAGKPIKEVRAALEAMRRLGTFSEDARRCIFSRRMARDTHISEVRRQAALKRASVIDRAKDGKFAPANDRAKPEQNPSVPASASASASATDLKANPQTPAVPHGEFPETAKAIRERYPEASDTLVMKLNIAVGQMVAGQNGKLKGLPTDVLMAEAVRYCARASPHQKSAGLYLSTVPQCVCTWLTQGKPNQQADQPEYYDSAKEKKKREEYNQKLMDEHAKRPPA